MTSAVTNHHTCIDLAAYISININVDDGILFTHVSHSAGVFLASYHRSDIKEVSRKGINLVLL